jgi:hypothetical protein
VNAQLVLLGLFFGGAFSAEEMADAAVDLGDFTVRIGRNVGMALVAGDVVMHRLFIGGPIDVSPHAFLPVARVAVILGICSC